MSFAAVALGYVLGQAALLLVLALVMDRHAEEEGEEQWRQPSNATQGTATSTSPNAKR